MKNGSVRFNIPAKVVDPRQVGSYGHREHIFPLTTAKNYDNNASGPNSRCRRSASRSDPTPLCGPDDVVVQVMECGICGSDLGYLAMGGLTGPDIPMPLGMNCGELSVMLALM